MKKITVISGFIDDTYRDMEHALEKLCGGEVFRVRDMNIYYCCGCLDCWVKTPGVCRHNDDMPQVLSSVINSDLCIFVSPLRMGFVTAQMKKATDKIIPLVHPYIGVFDGEFHHLKRYKRYPKLGLMIVDSNGEETESHEIVTQVYKRLAINLKTTLTFSVRTAGSLEEVENAISNL